MRIDKFILCMLALAGVATACSKELGKGGRFPAGEGSATTHSVDINFNIVGGVRTKAPLVADVPLTDLVQRLDIYTYYNLDPRLNDHYTIIPEDGKTASLHLEEKHGERVGVLVLGNLDEDTADSFEGVSLSDLASSSKMEGRIVLAAGNFDYDRIPMIGANDYTFFSDGSVTIDLYRIMSRIDVGKVNVEFADPALRGKEVRLKKIVIANAISYFKAIVSDSIGHFYSTYLYFKSTATLENAFGGVAKGFCYTCNVNNASATYAMDLGGKLSGTFPVEYNVAYRMPKGTLVVDAPGIIGEMTVHEFEGDDGLIVPQGDTAESHSLDVDACFYTIFASPNSPGPIVCDVGYDKNSQKLVLVMEIDGNTVFYPIELTHLQPNTVYQVDHITISKMGSEYPNFYVKKYPCEFSVSLKPWDIVNVDNIDVGYNDEEYDIF